MTEFTPRPWLRNAHLQSIIPSIPLRRSAVERRAMPLLQSSVEQVLDCGDGVRLLGLHATQERRGGAPARHLVVLHHGWEGSAESLYVLTLGQFLFERGFDVLRLNLRDHGPTHHLNRDLFHSCRIKEVVGAVRRIQSMYPTQRLSLTGFSLGGNFALRVGARAREAGIDLHRIVAISPVLDPEVTLAALKRALRSIAVTSSGNGPAHCSGSSSPGPMPTTSKSCSRSDADRDDGLPRAPSQRVPGSQDVSERLCARNGALESLETPSRIIAASDDPMIPSGDLEQLRDSPTCVLRRHARRSLRPGRGSAAIAGLPAKCWGTRRADPDFPPGAAVQVLTPRASFP